jgi:hypothetical protein
MHWLIAALLVALLAGSLIGAKALAAFSFSPSWAPLAKIPGFSKPIDLYARRRTPIVATHRPDFHHYFDGFPDFAEVSAAWLHGNLWNNSGDYTRLYMLYLNVRKVLEGGVPGDVVELGVYKGNSAFVLARMARTAGRKTFLYDTFQGFDSRDFKGTDAGRAVEFKDTSLEAVKQLVGCEGVQFVQGYFPESAADACPEVIAVAHIDCDLEEPMRAGLAMFYPRLAPGGLLILHDYASGFWPGATKAIDEFFADKPERPTIMPDKSGTAVVRRVALAAAAN